MFARSNVKAKIWHGVKALSMYALAVGGVAYRRDGTLLLNMHVTLYRWDRDAGANSLCLDIWVSQREPHSHIYSDLVLIQECPGLFFKAVEVSSHFSCMAACTLCKPLLRLMADVLNDLAILLNLIAPLFPDLFLLISCFASISRVSDSVMLPCNIRVAERVFFFFINRQLLE